MRKYKIPQNFTLSQVLSIKAIQKKNRTQKVLTKVAPTGIEPVFHAWEACVLATRRKRHKGIKKNTEVQSCFVAPTGIELVFVKKQGVRGMCPSHLFLPYLLFVAPTETELVFVKKQGVRGMCPSHLFLPYLLFCSAYGNRTRVRKKTRSERHVS